ncbi:MAG: type I DNA topoisomerase [Deltaproteobacteria bacterium]|jgi:DNA topoisomerase-1|nr:type I DNA topoisomerase [Deltaproteobacteria bacterium]
MTDLLIVESPAKAKTISKYLGPDFTVVASLGHIRDLPQSTLGVSIEEDFEPTYVTVPGKEKTLKELKKAAKDKGTVFLGPDPDREGEAIAWHIAESLGRDKHNFKRVLLHELTPDAVRKAMAEPVDISQSLLESQQTRRILDRLMGYLISPVLWNKLKRGLSAGRVQSVALRLVVERERQIFAFVPQEYWSLEALFRKDGQAFKAQLARKGGKKIELGTGPETEAVVKAVEGRPFTAASVVSSERRRFPPPAFTTSTLQQAAFGRLGLAPARTMRLAQQLYEGVELPEGTSGLITYMRTDSVRVSDQAAQEARSLAAARFGSDHVPAVPNRFKNRKGAQDAHEAIRPAKVSRTPESLPAALPGELRRLYSLIWCRFVGSQMTPAVFLQTRADLECEGYVFRATGQVRKFDGYLAAWGGFGARTGEGGPGAAGESPLASEGSRGSAGAAPDGTEGVSESEDPEGNGGAEGSGGGPGAGGSGEGGSASGEDSSLPELAEGEKLTPEALLPAQHFTQPPPRYNDATLVKELESKGIGRPSTYAATISVLRDKGYAEGPKGQLRPTEMGFMVNDLLVGSFPRLLDVAFTAAMEEDLDQIEEGRAERLSVLRKLYLPLAESLDEAKNSMLNVKTAGVPAEDTACPKCGVRGEMRIRYGKSGFYLSCGACGATCDFTRDGKGVPVPVPEPELDGEVHCDLCGSPMLIKKGRFGPFLACSAYPDCRNTKPILVENGRAQPLPKEEPPELPEGSPRTCPKCGGELTVKRSRKGSWFLGCSNYPKCKETRPFPTGFTCPASGCGGEIIERSSKRGAFHGCSNYPKCRFRFEGEPALDPCPECGFPWRYRSLRRGPDSDLICPNRGCPTYRPSRLKGADPEDGDGRRPADAPAEAAASSGGARPSRAKAGAKPKAAADEGEGAPAKPARAVRAKAGTKAKAAGDEGEGAPAKPARAVRAKAGAKAKAAGDAGGDKPGGAKSGTPKN